MLPAIKIVVADPEVTNNRSVGGINWTAIVLDVVVGENVVT